MPTTQSKLSTLREKAGDEAVDALLQRVAATHGEAAAAGVTAKAKKPAMMEMEEDEEGETKKPNPFAKKDKEEVDDVDPDLSEELALIAETVAETVGPAFDAVAERLEALGTKAAKFDEYQTKEKTLETQLAELKTTIKSLSDALADLTGDQTRAAKKGYRPSADEKTITEKGKSEGPQSDNFLAQFISDFALGQPQK